MRTLSTLRRRTIEFTIGPRRPFMARRFVYQFRRRIFRRPKGFTSVCQMVRFRRGQQGVILFIHSGIRAQFNTSSIFFRRGAINIRRRARISITINSNMSQYTNVSTYRAFARFLYFTYSINFDRRGAINMTGLKLNSNRLIRLLVNVCHVRRHGRTIRRMALTWGLVKRGNLGGQTEVNRTNTFGSRAIRLGVTLIRVVRRIR